MIGRRPAGGRLERRLARLSVTLAGAGRAGSFAALVLGMAGVRSLRVYDHDLLDPERNLAVQLYRASDIRARRAKVEALRELLLELVPSVEIVACPERFEGRREQAIDPVVVLGVDDMATRASLAKRLARRPELALLIDLRLGGSVMQCLCVRGRCDMPWYRSTLHEDSEAWGGICGAGPAAHVGAGAAAFVAGVVMAHLRDADFPRRIAVDFDSAAFVVEPREPGGG